MFTVVGNHHREYWVNLKHAFLLKQYAADLEHLNTLDGLTELKNRKFFDQSLKYETKKAIRSRSSLSLLFIDIDHFKQVNDRYGHLAGDDCLRRISTVLKEHARRETDIVARYGGEEFAVIIPDSAREHAVNLAEKIRKAVEKMDAHYDEIQILLTVSIGVSSIIPQPGDLETTLIKQADNALYEAKDNGRNRVKVALT